MVWSKVADLRQEDGSEWNFQLLQEICDPTTVKAIRRMDWPQTQCYDKLLWIGNNSGVFSVKSCCLTDNLNEFYVEAIPI